MKNTSESPAPEGNEQAKTATPRSRSSTRSKSESTPAAGAINRAPTQETKPVTRRRTTASTASSNGTTTAPRMADARAATTIAGEASADTTTPGEVTPGETAPRTPTARRSSATPITGAINRAPTDEAASAATGQGQAIAPTRTPKKAATPPIQKEKEKESSATKTPVQRADVASTPAQPGSSTPTPPVSRTGAASMPTQQSGGTTQQPVQRTGAINRAPTEGAKGNAAQRPGGTAGTPVPGRDKSGPYTGNPAQRPGSTGTPTGRNELRPYTGNPAQRPGGTGTPTGRNELRPYTPQTQQRPTGYVGTGTPVRGVNPATQPRPTTGRPASGGSGSSHPGTSRPGSAVRPGATRPGTGGTGHAGTTRPGGRPGAPAHRPPERRAPVVKEKPTGPVSIPPQIVVKDLAELLHATPNEIIRGLIKHGIFANINQIVEYDKAALVAQELTFEPSLSTLTVAPAVQSDRGLSANEAMMATRHEDNMVVIPPVVTIMGHVDHGKTSLLDTIRKTKVAAGEAGGITQHIGAYQVEVNGKKITFLDTPGHEAFTAMRARGAQVTHIAIIVVAADDGVMPQTREAIDHAQAAKVPIIIALNKIDKANANPDHVKQQLAEIGVVIEEYGGDVVCVPVSARRGTGIDELLEMILLVAEVQDIKANPNRPATGVIIEAKLEKSTGPTATVLIQQGTLKMGDNIVVGPLSGKVRAMFNDRGKRIQKAPPSTPVSILGLPEVPNAGDRLEVVADDRTAKQKATRIAEQRRSESMPLGQVSLDTLYMQMQEGTVKELNIVLKCDVQGSAEAIKHALTKVGEENIKVRLIHEGIGNISETDVHLAAASGAVIIGFNVKADGAAQRQAQKEGVDIRYYNVIYKLTDDIQAALTGMLEPTFREVIEGHAEVMQTFKAGKTTVIAGCRITDGKIVRSSQARILRKNAKVYDGKIASLRRGKDDVREVASGYECGIVLEDFTEFEVGDIIEAYAQERVKAGA
ncbi:MAG TPA: translation initiation factor IF-2 [Ktedonobacteraceae bacterium]|nr:translation initiation factor IF-2 [Ktedonobacteraceae bacterium]